MAALAIAIPMQRTKFNSQVTVPRNPKASPFEQTTFQPSIAPLQKEQDLKTISV